MSYQGDLSNLLEEGGREYRPIAPLSDYRQSDDLDNEGFTEHEVEAIVYNEPDPPVREHDDEDFEPEDLTA